MIRPSLEEVRAYAAQGEYRRVPVSTEILSDLYTPMQVLRKLKNVSDHCYLLESAEAQEKWGRYTFLGFDPTMEITCLDGQMKIGALSFDTKARTASAHGEPLTLTRKETGILEYLMLNQGRPISQEELIDHVWDNSVDNFSNSIRVHISALRKKLRTALGYDPIRNRIGEGYLIEGAEE